MTGFLDVLLRALGSVGLAAAAGGPAYVLLVLRPRDRSSSFVRSAVRRALALIAWGAVAVAASEATLALLVHPWALADSRDRWPVALFLTTDFGRAGVVRVILALGLVIVAFGVGRRPGSVSRWTSAVLLCVLLLVDSAWLAHAASRLQGRAALMAATVLHQLGAVIWVGGIIQLVGLASLWRQHRETECWVNLPRQTPLALARDARRTSTYAADGWLPRASTGSQLGPACEADVLVARLLVRFSPLAAAAMGLLLGPGLYLSWTYIASWDGLIGTGYGIMVLTKVALLGAMGILAALNFRLLSGPSLDARSLALRVPALIEAEVGIGLTVLLAAASLTSLPPAADVVADRASPSEVLTRFVPRLPRWTSPPVGQLLAAAAPIDDLLAPRRREEYAWSEYNHHAAGFVVLLMGLLAALDRTGRAPWARHWPLLFLGLAVFLFVRNDPRAWPLGPAGFWESMALPDVLQHRLAVLVVAGLGVFEWLVRTGRLVEPGWRFVFPALCAVGGALLLTHSHAMLSIKSELLTEVSHAPMGILGVLLGWGRWLELRLPVSDRGVPARVWAASMVLIGVVLLVYRET